MENAMIGHFRINAAPTLAVSECDFCRHTRFEDSFVVVNAHFHAEYLISTFFEALDVARRVFGFIRNLKDRPRESSIGVCVHRRRDLLIEPNPSELSFGNINPDPQVRRAKHADDGRVGSHQVTPTDRNDFDHDGLVITSPLASLTHARLFSFSAQSF